MRQEVDFATTEDPTSTGQDTGGADAGAVRPIINGEAGVAGTFNRSAEILRTRTEVLRKEVADLKFLSDADRGLLMFPSNATDRLTWTGLAGGPPAVGTIDTSPAPSANLVLRPWLTPGAVSKPSKLVLAAADAANEVTLETLQSGSPVLRAYSGANDISLTIRKTGNAGSSVTVTGGSADFVSSGGGIVWDDTFQDDGTGRHFVASIDDSVTFEQLRTALAGSTYATSLNFSATGTGGSYSGAGSVVTELSLTTPQRFFFSGAYDAETHPVPFSTLKAFTETPGNELREGDVLAVAYDALVTNSGYGGRRQSLAEAPETSPGTATPITASQLFIARKEPEKLPGALPICSVVNGKLLFVNGAMLAGGDSGSPTPGTAVATQTYSGTVKLNSAPGSATDPKVVPVLSNGGISVTATGTNTDAITGQGTGTGAGVRGVGGAIDGFGVRGIGAGGNTGFVASGVGGRFVGGNNTHADGLGGGDGATAQGGNAASTGNGFGRGGAGFSGTGGHRGGPGVRGTGGTGTALIASGTGGEFTGGGGQAGVNNNPSGGIGVIGSGGVPSSGAGATGGLFYGSAAVSGNAVGGDGAIGTGGVGSGSSSGGPGGLFTGGVGGGNSGTGGAGVRSTGGAGGSSDGPGGAGADLYGGNGTGAGDAGHGLEARGGTGASMPGRAILARSVASGASAGGFFTPVIDAFASHADTTAIVGRVNGTTAANAAHFRNDNATKPTIEVANAAAGGAAIQVGDGDVRIPNDHTYGYATAKTGYDYIRPNRFQIVSGGTFSFDGAEMRLNTTATAAFSADISLPPDAVITHVYIDVARQGAGTLISDGGLNGHAFTPPATLTSPIGLAFSPPINKTTADREILLAWNGSPINTSTANAGCFYTGSLATDTGTARLYGVIVRYNYNVLGYR